MRPKPAILLAAVPILLLGCQSKSQPRPAASLTAEAIAMRSLARLSAAPALPATRPATRPSPSLDVIELFARGRGLLDDNQPFRAAEALEEALALDPDSFELHYTLGQAHAATNVANDKAVAAFTRAAQLEPQNILPWMQLAKLASQRKEPEEAIRLLRLAMQTPDYQSRLEDACLVDFQLARALQDGAHHEAAADRYRLALYRLDALGGAMHGSRELYQLMSHPEAIYGPLGDSLSSLGETERAAAAYAAAREAAPGDFELAAKEVRCLVKLRRFDEARAQAAKAVSRFRASDASIALLRETFPAGADGQVIAQLRKLREASPQDMAMAFALADALGRAGQAADARATLDGAVTASGYDMAAVKRLYDLDVQAGRLSDAARLLIVTVAARPQFLNECNPLMAQLLRMGRKNHLALRDLQAIQVEPAAEAAKLYWVSRVADNWARDELARITLEKAARAGKPFAPAYRLLLVRYWARGDWDTAHKSQQSETLAILAEAQGSAALAAEVRGHAAAARKDLAAAATCFEQALKLGGPQPDVQTAYALVQIQRGHPVEGEQTLWDVTREAPLFEGSYTTLIGHYLDKGAVQSALRALGAWRQADPANIEARLIESNIFLHSRRPDLAEKTLLELFRGNSDNDAVLLAIQGLYAQSNRLGEFISMLEQDRAAHPENRTVAERLVELYAAQRRLAEAHRVLDDLHTSARGDTDLLYYLSHLYMRLDEKKAALDVLEEVLRLDPRHTSAANDLGYFLADEGRNLPRAEKLVRQALADEPDNQSFLDSVAWVLYKRGQFAEASQLLARAVQQSIDPDPVVLDHYGDAAYRLGDRAQALTQWRRASQRLRELGPARPDLRTLGLQLLVKLQSAGAGKPAKVAPIAGEITTTAPATTSSMPAATQGR